MCRAARLFARACLPVGMGFDTQDLLRQGGFTPGDRVVSTATVFQTDSEASTAIGTFGSFGRGALVDFSQYPDSATVEARLVFLTGSTMDTDGDYRLSIQDSTGSVVSSGPIETVQAGNTSVVATTDAIEVGFQGVGRYRGRLRSDGTNTISIVQAFVQVEVVL